MTGVFEYLLYDEYQVLGKEQMESFIILSVYVIREAYQMLLVTHWLVRV